MWRAARNASSVNGGRLPYSLGTVASAARPSQLNTARQTSLGRFRPIASISQEVLTRKEGTVPLAPCPLCAASIPPLTSRGRTTSKARRGRLYEGAHARSPDRASAHPGRRSAMALHLLSFSIPPSQWSGAGGTASDACNNAPSRRISRTSAADRPRGRDARRRGCVSSASICAVGSRSRADLHRLARDAYSILRSRAAEHPCERHARRHGGVGVALH